jgi:hypothetical protein
MSQAPKIISPTIGRCLWYWPSDYDRGLLTTKPETIIEANTTQACDAHVVCVHGDRLINIALFDHNGKLHRRTSVTLVQPGDMPHEGASFCTWMDYQVNQAQTEEATGKVEVVVTVDDSVLAKDLEAAIVAAGANVAPRITPEDIKANIVSEHYFTAAQGVDMSDPEMTDAKMPPSLKLLTFCVIVLSNDFTVTGESACASPENFNFSIGCRIARENAVAKIYPLMGHELRSKLKAQKQAAPATGISPNATLNTEDPDHAEA